MELRSLATFRVLAQTLNFTQTAEQLGYVQSSITAQIQGLEAELGVPLFNRLGRRVSLTEAGQRLLIYAEKMLTLADEATNAVVGSEEISGTITIGTPETICTYRLPPVLRLFRQHYRQVRLIFKLLSPTHLPYVLTDSVIDLAFTLDIPLNLHRLQVETLIEESICLLVDPTHPLAHCEIVTPDMIQDEMLLLTERGCGYRSAFERLLADSGIRMITNMEFSSVEAIKQCAMVGLGIAVLPRVAVEKQLASGELCTLNWSRPFQVYTHLIWHKEKWISPALEAFLNTSRAVLQNA